MKNRALLLIAMFLLLCGTARASTTLYRVRFGYFPDKIRAVFDFDGAFTYQTEESRDRIVIFLKDIEAAAGISNYVELNDLVVRFFEVEQYDERHLKITIPLGEPIDYNVFYLNDPPRLVVDFDREFLNIVSGGTVADGAEFLKVRKGTADGRITATVLKVDLDKMEVEPALARWQKPTAVESFVGLFTPWAARDISKRHFALQRVSDIVAENGGLAGINGSFFAFTGSPLGALVINQELISAPIHGRTAFFLDDMGRPYIDNIYISSYFTLASGVRYRITGVNQGRGSSDLIMYTPAWGKYTGTNDHGLELAVVGGRVNRINVANSEIPEDGYVLSASGPGVESLSEGIRVGARLDTHIRIVPYSTAPRKIVHLVSGGPRLLLKGRPYVSKHEEKFRTDVAKGRAARTAIGVTDQNEVLLVTVDGPPRRNGQRRVREPSIGMTLEELSDLMLALGAQEAMNLDGGSSSTMVIKDKVVNRPTGGSERGINNALILRARP